MLSLRDITAMLNKNWQVFTSHGNTIIVFGRIDTTMRAFEKERWSSKIGIIGLIWSVEYVFCGAIAMKEMLVTTNDKGSLCTE